MAAVVGQLREINFDYALWCPNEECSADVMLCALGVRDENPNAVSRLPQQQRVSPVSHRLQYMGPFRRGGFGE